MTFHDITLDDKYDLSKKRVFLNGTQALVRLCLTQASRDQAAGLKTAGYVTGYRGSPLGGLDQQFARAAKQLSESAITFEPGLNEDLAATAVWGAQQAELRGEGRYDGVFSIWYGKGPGVDRSGDVLRHANLAGTSRNGGVLVLMGDDHTCESSTTAHQSEYALVDAMIPVLNPANLQEVLEYGLHGWALSRFSGLWCGLKCVKDTIESTASIDVPAEGFETRIPVEHSLPMGGLNIRTGDTPLAQEERLHKHKVAAAQAYARENRLDRVAFGNPVDARLGIVTTGKSYMDVLQALADLGVDNAKAKELGIVVYKVAMSWPLEPVGVVEFAKRLEQIIVVEEKRGLIEDQLRSLLYQQKAAPEIIGKSDERGNTLFQSFGALNPMQIAVAIGERAMDAMPDAHVSTRLATAKSILNSEQMEMEVQRKPYFCAGCPHNRSTVLPGGARGYAGIGCHWMAQFMDRNVDGYTHMGGEGANWIGEAQFSKRGHVFQNLGDGTYNHSGLMALRAAARSDTNITFKILYNDAVAMTGGQSHEGGLTVRDIAAEVVAAGARRLVLVSDQPELHRPSDYPPGMSIHHRDDIQAVQEELSREPGTTVMIYDQTCAAEKRRRRKRGTMEDPDRRVLINEDVCEGCGDCGIKSNCVAIVPVETEFGRKRQIDQSSCNKDFSCTDGFCPSFVTIEGGTPRKPKAANLEIPDIPEPSGVISLERPYSIVLSGVGGTGVVTIGALLGMAAHIEQRGCGIIDMAGLAQKGGAVTSHIKLAKTPDEIGTIRVAPGGMDLLLGCDSLVSAGASLLALVKKERTRAIINTNEFMTGAFTRDPDFKLPVSLINQRLKTAMDEDAVTFVNATDFAEKLLGNTIGANLFVLGVAYQNGLIPLTSAALHRAIELNGVSVDFNKRAFDLGRWWVFDQNAVESSLEASTVTTRPKHRSVADLVSHRASILTQYQNEAYARRYIDTVSKVQAVDQGETLTEMVARNLFKLMAYKDEYEVARLYTNGAFAKKLERSFEGDVRVKLHLAPPVLAKRDKSTGLPRKRQFGPWILKVMRILAKLKGLRGTPFDIFGYTSERRAERALIEDYEDLVDTIVSNYSTRSIDDCLELTMLPDMIRGFGHIKEANIKRYNVRKAELLKVLEKRSVQELQRSL